MTGKVRVGVLVSGGGSNLQAIIDASASNRIDAEVAFVGSDNPEAYGLTRARKHGIRTFAVDYKKILQELRKGRLEDRVPEDFDWDSLVAKQGLRDTASGREALKRFFSSRAVCEAALLREMEACPFDLLALAGFMRVLTPYFIDHVNVDPTRPRIMNIHPALLPAFPGNDGYGDTFRYGCKVGGCTVHFVDYGEDTGPIIGQKAFEIEPHESLDEVRAEGLKLEWELYPECIQLFAEGRLKVVTRVNTLKDGSEFMRKVVEIAR